MRAADDPDLLTGGIAEDDGGGEEELEWPLVGRFIGSESENSTSRACRAVGRYAGFLFQQSSASSQS